MKKFIALALAALMLLSLAACGDNTPSTTPAPAQTTAAPAQTTAAPAQTTAAPAATTENPADPSGSGDSCEWDSKGLPAITAGCLAGKKVVLTSAGQSSDVSNVVNGLKKQKVDYFQNNVITANELTSDYQVLILVVGGSSKGLGGAGLDQVSETARLTALMDKAKANGATIIAMHTGKADRRGTLSDAFIDLVFPKADYAIIVVGGDDDNHMHDILAASNAAAAYVEKVSQTASVVASMLGK